MVYCPDYTFRNKALIPSAVRDVDIVLMPTMRLRCGLIS